jgi:hypothetical protein
MGSAYLPTPSFFPAIHKTFTDHLAFDFNWIAISSALYMMYYFVLDPIAAVSLPSAVHLRI